MKFELLKLDGPNKNNRIYPRSVMEKAINDAQTLVKENRMFVIVGTEHDSYQMDISKSAAILTRLEINENAVVGETRTLDLPLGKFVDDLLSQPNTKLQLRMAGMGRIQKNEKGQYVVSDYEMTHAIFTSEGA